MAKSAIGHDGSAKSDRSATARVSFGLSPDAKALAAIAVLWLAMVIVANPLGNFPLNDDCQFAKTVKALLETGQLKMTHTYASYLGNIPWGTLFCLPFGFSFMALRISSLTLGLIGSWVTYGLIRHCGASRTVALIGGLCVVANPVYFVLSNTYMTDVPFLVYAAVSGYFFVRGLKTDSWLMIAAGTLICCLAAATRTFGLILPLAFLAAYVWKSGFGIRSLLKGVLPLVIVTVAFLLCPSAVQNAGRLFSSNEGTTTWQGLQSNMAVYLASVRSEALLTVTYLGLYCLPLLIVTPWWEVFRFRLPAWLSSEPRRTRHKPAKDSHGAESEYVSKSDAHRQVVLMIGLSAALVAALIWLASSIIDRIMLGAGGNILNEWGLGPITLTDAYIIGTANLPTLGVDFWKNVSMVAFVGGSIMALQLLRLTWNAIRSLRARITSVPELARAYCLIGFLMLYVGTLALLGLMNFLDRYILPVVPFLLCVLASTSDSKRRVGKFWIALAAAVLLSYSVFAVAGTHDYLSWNRARWSALNDLIDVRKVNPRDIDGGYEYCVWRTWGYSDAPHYQSPKGWWVLYNNKYILSFDEMAWIPVIRRYPYSRWLPDRRTDYIYVNGTIGR